MPNGLPWTKEGFAALEAFFAQLEPALTDFATARNLRIERYYHDSPSWSSLFRHPHDGVGKIDVERDDNHSVRIRRYWWKDEFETGARFLRSETSVMTNVSRANIGAAMGLALDEVLAWPSDTLEPHPGMKDVWHKAFDEESFRAQERKYPLLRLA